MRHMILNTFYCYHCFYSGFIYMVYLYWMNYVDVLMLKSSFFPHSHSCWLWHTPSLIITMHYHHLSYIHSYFPSHYLIDGGDKKIRLSVRALSSKRLNWYASNLIYTYIHKVAKKRSLLILGHIGWRKSKIGQRSYF